MIIDPFTAFPVSQNTPFIFEINSANTSTGSSASDQFSLPLVSGGSYDFNVDWGDGSDDDITAYDQAEVTHTYASSGTYTITIIGTIAGIKFANSGDRLKLLDISSFGSLDLISNSVFQGCANLDISAVDSPQITTTDFSNLFWGCTSLTEIGGLWDVSLVTTMTRLFRECTNFIGTSIEGWDTSSLVTANAVFHSCGASVNPDISAWNTSLVQTLNQIFRDCNGFDRNLSAWDISNCTNFDLMLFGGGLSTANYDALLIAWAAQSVQSGMSPHFGTSKYTSGGAAEAARDTLYGPPNNWLIMDGGAL